MEIDLSKEDAVKAIFDTVEQKLGTVAILVNNATHSTLTDLGGITPQQLDRHYFVNVRAPIMLTAEFVKRFDESQSGRIIHL